MGFLEKAARSDARGKARSSLLARARDARDSAEKTSVQLSVERLFGLEAELLGLPDLVDYPLSVWSAITRSLPLTNICLFLRRGSSFLPAAVKGYSPSEDSLPEISPQALGEAGTLVPASYREKVESLLRSPAGECSRWAGIPRSGELVGLWVYSDPSLESLDPTIQARLGRLLVLPSAQLSIGLRLAEPLIQPAADLVSSLSGSRNSVAFRLDLAPIFVSLKDSYPGVMPLSFASAMECSARKILGASGSARLIGLRTLASVLGSLSPVDPELACFQFLKSLKRSLAFLGGISLPPGSAIALDPAARETEERLSRFLAD